MTQKESNIQEVITTVVTMVTKKLPVLDQSKTV